MSYEEITYQTAAGREISSREPISSDLIEQCIADAKRMRAEMIGASLQRVGNGIRRVFTSLSDWARNQRTSPFHKSGI